MDGGPEVAKPPHRFTHVIPALVAGIQSAAGCSACGWMDPGDKPRDDSRAVRGPPHLMPEALLRHDTQHDFVMTPRE